MTAPYCQSLRKTASSPLPAHPSRRFWVWLKTGMQQLGQFFQQRSGDASEPKVWQKFDRQGNPQGWRVFDPGTGRTIALSSELEVRLWLERRFYH